MNNETFPITPPPELVYEWRDSGGGFDDVDFATQAARWGADQELEACCEWVGQFNYDDYSYQERLRAARRRPKPPSLKEQALAALNKIEDEMLGPTIEEKLIRRALESLPS